MARRNSVEVVVDVDSDDAVRNLGRVDDAIGETVGSFQRLGTAVRLGAAAALGVTLAGIVSQSKEAQEATSRLDGTFARMGDTIGITRERVDEIAKSIERSTKFTGDAVKDAAGSLALFDRVSGETFERTLKLSVDLAAVMKTDVPDAAEALGRALQMPGEGLRILTAAGIKFSDEETKKLQLLTESGRAAEAQAVILGELERRVKGAGDETRNNLNGALDALGNTLSRLTESESGIGALTRMVNNFTDNINVLSDGRLKRLNTELALFQNNLRTVDPDEAGTKRFYETRIRYLEEEIRAETTLQNLRGSGKPGRGSRGSPSLNIGGTFVPDKGIPDIEDPKDTAKRMDAITAVKKGRYQQELELFRDNEKYIEAELDEHNRRLKQQDEQYFESRKFQLDDLKEYHASNLEQLEARQNEFSENLRFPFDNFREGFKDAFDDMIRTGDFSAKHFVRTLIAELARKELFEAIDKIGDALTDALSSSGAGSGGSGFLGSAIGWLFSKPATAAAGGGRVSGRVRVGEEGPEILDLGSRSGYVYNKRQMGDSAGSSLVYSPKTIFQVEGNMTPDTEARLYGYIEQTRKQDQIQMQRMLERNGFGRMR